MKSPQIDLSRLYGFKTLAASRKQAPAVSQVAPVDKIGGKLGGKLGGKVGNKP